MRFDFTLDLRNPAGRPWAELWDDAVWLYAQAETLGFDRLLVQEHFFTLDGYAPSSIAFLTRLADACRRARIGSYTFVLPQHNALRLAQETAVIDHFSGGRLDVCVGAGHRALEYIAFGMNPNTRPSRMEEGLTVLKGGWTQRPFSFHGRYYDFDGITVTPEPAQFPHPPLWVAATSAAATERAGRHGSHLAMGGAVDDEILEAYDRGLAQAGLSRSAMRISTPFAVTVTDKANKVWDRNRELYFERWDFYRKIRAEMGDPQLDYGREPTPDSYRANELIGTPDEVLGALEPLLTGRGITDFVYSGPPGGVDLRTEAYEDLVRFAAEVMPTMRSW